MSLTKIIGIGSPFGDDQAGWLAADALQPYANKNLEIISVDRPQLNVINLFVDVDKVVLIDAVKSYHEIGYIHQIKSFTDLDHSLLLSSHGFGIKQAVQLAHVLEILPKDFIFYGIEIGDNKLTDVIDNKVEQAVAQLIQMLKLCPVFRSSKDHSF